MANLKRPELKLGGNMSENFKNFELRFHDYCIQADYRNLAKNPETERADYYKKPLLEISALRSAMPDEALQVIRYTIEPQIAADDQKKTMDLDGQITTSLHWIYRKLPIGGQI
ncbi:unnamed protein product [Pocillopora meandrina]|uniref:Uncharacterized protein n=1 Tax=Pocillopora meandrina TaxID=46732 RepID=A0AAU9VYC5_9CNID|nr:unnamed protein product [Pocillopora meandrina]